MILCTTSTFADYVHLHPLFSHAHGWLSAGAWRTLADGTYELRGSDLFVILESGTTWDRAVRRYESHRRYIDIQVSLSGGETMDWQPADTLTVADDFQPTNDIRFYHNPSPTAATAVRVEPGMIALFYPADAHRPVLHLEGHSAPYRKAVFKVAVTPCHVD